MCQTTDKILHMWLTWVRSVCYLDLVMGLFGYWLSIRTCYSSSYYLWLDYVKMLLVIFCYDFVISKPVSNKWVWEIPIVQTWDVNVEWERECIVYWMDVPCRGSPICCTMRCINEAIPYRDSKRTVPFSSLKDRRPRRLCITHIHAFHNLSLCSQTASFRHLLHASPKDQDRFWCRYTLEVSMPPAVIPWHQ